jgi:phage tail-like protein
MPPQGPPRPTYPMPLPDGPSSRYLRYLPGLFHDDDFLGRFLLIMEAIWEPLEQRQDHIELYANPRTCPESFLGWLGSWLSLALDDHWPEARRRNLLKEAMDLYRWRGTRYGLMRMIEVCTGLAPEIDDVPAPSDSARSEPFVFRVRLTIPPDAGVDRELVETLVRAHKPAHAGYVLEVRQLEARAVAEAGQ